MLFVAAKGKLHHRTKRLVISAASAVVNKGIMLIVNLVSVPIMVRYLGAELFGIWAILSTTLTLLLTFDLGVSSSLTNFISEAYAHDDKDFAGTYSTTAFGIMTGLSLLLGLLAWIIWPWLHWQQLFHLSSPAESSMVSRAAAGALGVLLLGMPASLGAKILGGYQELGISNAFAAAGGVLNLIGLLLLVWMHAGLAALTIASCGILVAINVVSVVWIWACHKPWLMPRFRHLTGDAARRLMGSGWKFFVLQIAALLSWGTDNFVITHYLGPAQVVPYNVTWRLAGYMMAAQALLTPSLWPAYSEAFVRGDIEWIRRTFRRTLLLTMSAAAVFAIVLALIGRQLIYLWASRVAVPSETLLLLMCLWILISTLMTSTVTILLAKGEVTLQVWCSITSALVNFALSIYLVQRMGAAGVILGTILAYLLILVVPQNWKVWKVLTESGTRTGGRAQVPAGQIHETEAPGS